ncbi:MAG TPA: DMT family transporter [Thermoclostridium sp.]
MDKLEKRKELLYSLLLLLAAIIWGFAFVVQSNAMETIGPLSFNCVRWLIGSLSVLPVCALVCGKNREKIKTEDIKEKRKHTLAGGCLCGIFLFAASNTQQIGLVETPPGKAGFITALYIVIVPLFGLLRRKIPEIKIWISVALATAGLYLMCVTKQLTIEKSDIWVIICAFCYALQIVTVDSFSDRADPVKLAFVQFLVCGILGVPFALIFEQPTVAAFRESLILILYVGVLSSGVAFTLQVVAQKKVKPTIASLLMSMESVFSVLFSWLVLHQTLSLREYTGVILMTVAIILAQI